MGKAVVLFVFFLAAAGVLQDDVQQALVDELDCVVPVVGVKKTVYDLGCPYPVLDQAAGVHDEEKLLDDGGRSNDSFIECFPLEMGDVGEGLQDDRVGVCAGAVE